MQVILHYTTAEMNMTTNQPEPKITRHQVKWTLTHHRTKKPKSIAHVDNYLTTLPRTSHHLTRLSSLTTLDH